MVSQETDPKDPSCQTAGCFAQGCSPHKHPEFCWKFGKTAGGDPRWRCRLCRSTFSEGKGARRHKRSDRKQKAESWDRWQRAESMSSIGRQFDRASSSIYPLLERTGGIRPSARGRSGLALALADREQISRGLIANLSLETVARNLTRPASTTSREVKRNGGAKQ